MKYSEQLIIGEKYSRKQLSSLLNEVTLDGSREENKVLSLAKSKILFGFYKEVVSWFSIAISFF